MKFVIYNELGTFKMTTEENYKKVFKNAREIGTWKGFDNAEEIIKYCVKYCGRSAEDFIIA